MLLAVVINGEKKFVFFSMTPSPHPPRSASTDPGRERAECGSRCVYVVAGETHTPEHFASSAFGKFHPKRKEKIGCNVTSWGAKERDGAMICA